MQQAAVPLSTGNHNSDHEVVRIYVWELPVRLAHWGFVCSLIVLACTGYYMHNPFVAVHSRTAWVMATIRYVHVLSGWVLLASLLVRLYWLFKGNIWANWRAFIPLTARQRKSLRGAFQYYTFQRGEPFPQIGHNTLAALTYLVVFAILGWECLTGVVLYSEVLGKGMLYSLVGWIPRIIDIQTLRMTHYLFMFLLIGFGIHHVYSAILVAREERNALMESIYTGYKFAPESLLDEEIDAALYGGDSSEAAHAAVANAAKVH
ncbi:MAG TPA: Ni/Fe-hydrogenase, b-type cytochrome subunit [Acidisarcina sp.]|nr:Ni/Fe-hydrogenase, b-type cytochrome subunit [Acidisarcina sp.]